MSDALTSGSAALLALPWSVAAPRMPAVITPRNVRKCLVVLGVVGSLWWVSSWLAADEFLVRPEGDVTTTDFKLYFTKDGETISPWHDIPLRTDDGYVNFVNEIPKGERAKMEINKETPHNPIIQDTKKGKLRFYHSDSLVNYGAFPQTWENPHELDATSQMKGDGDPLDVVDISDIKAQVGEVYPVKVLGALMMMDGGEADWKIVVIRQSDPRSEEVHDVSDQSIQTKLTNMRIWFRDYKLPDGKPENEFAFDGEFQPPSLAVKVIDETHRHWLELKQNPSKYPDMWVGDQE